MSLPFRCVNGHEFVDDKMVKFAGSGTGNFFSGMRTNCTICGAMAENITGRYDHSNGRISAASSVAPQDRAFIDAVIKAFRAPDVNKEKVEALKVVAEAAKRGSISSEEAEQAAFEISTSLGDLWKWLNQNGAALGIASLILTVALWYLSDQSSNQTSAQAHADVMLMHQDAQAALVVHQKQLEVSEKQLEVSQQQFQEKQHDREVQEKLYVLLAEQRQIGVRRAQQSQLKQPRQVQGPSRGLIQNRHERRKAATVEKHGRKP